MAVGDDDEHDLNSDDGKDGDFGSGSRRRE